MTTTTIQIHEDVKARLIEEREDEKESFNDTLRRLLDMNEPESLIPHHYEGSIELYNVALLGFDSPIMDAIINHKEWDGSLNEVLELNGIKVRIEVKQPLTMKLNGDTEDEVIAKTKELFKFGKISEDRRKEMEIHMIGLTQVDCKTGKRLDKETDRYL